MRRIRVIFENEGKKVGYIIDPKEGAMVSGDFSDDAEQIVDVSQQGKIDNPEEFCRQIYYVLLAGVKE